MLKIARVLLLGLLLIFWFRVWFAALSGSSAPPQQRLCFRPHVPCRLPAHRAARSGYHSGRGQVGGLPVYVCNHQSNFDIFTVTGAVRPAWWRWARRACCGCPSSAFIFWLSGSVLIDRSNRSRAIGTIGQVVDRIKTTALPSGCSRKGPAPRPRSAAVQGGRLPHRRPG